jgi:regulator of nonsense transcripts 2
MRLKTAKHLDPLADTLVQNAYYMCKPPERISRVKTPRDPIYLYMLNLLYLQLSSDTVGKVVRAFRKFDWDDIQTFDWMIKAVLKVSKSQVLHMGLVCNVVATLSR